MGAFLSMAQLIANRLNDEFAENECRALADNMTDAPSMIQSHLAKLSGSVILVEWNGGKVEKNGSSLRIMSRFNLACIFSPLISRGARLDHDAVVQRAALAVHLWHPNPSSPSYVKERFEIDNIKPPQIISEQRHVVTVIEGKMTQQIRS